MGAVEKDLMQHAAVIFMSPLALSFLSLPFSLTPSDPPHPFNSSCSLFTLESSLHAALIARLAPENAVPPLCTCTFSRWLKGIKYLLGEEGSGSGRCTTLSTSQQMQQRRGREHGCLISLHQSLRRFGIFFQLRLPHGAFSLSLSSLSRPLLASRH